MIYITDKTLRELDKDILLKMLESGEYQIKYGKFTIDKEILIKTI